MLQNLNDQFLQNHTKAGKSALKDIQSVIIYKGGILSLWSLENNTCHAIENIELIQKRYTLLKQIAHIPVLLLTTIKGALSTDQGREGLQAILVNLSMQLKLIVNGIDGILPPEDLQVQKLIVKNTIDTIDEMLKNQDKSSIEALLATYMKGLSEPLGYNQRKATEIQLNTLHHVITEWKEKHMINLEKSRVLIVGPHGPRDKLIEMLYFSELYKHLGVEEPENNRLYYVEVLPSQISTLDCEKDLIDGFLAGSEINKTIGKKMLGGKKEMFSDILHHYAMPIIKEILAKENVSNTYN